MNTNLMLLSDGQPRNAPRPAAAAAKYIGPREGVTEIRAFRPCRFRRLQFFDALKSYLQRLYLHLATRRVN